tara:strand:+ start:436 stop:591 length:156 start_codon:yes stop_codon:yes gene_type:complete
MTIAEILQIADMGGTLALAVLVYMELRSMRKESLSLMQELTGYIKGRADSN